MSCIVFPPVGLSHPGMVSGREKGCYFAGGNQNGVRMEKSGNRPRECPGTPQQARASPICPAGRFYFKRKWQVVCCGTRNEFRASPPPCPLDVASPSGVGGCSRGRAVGIRRFQTMFHLKFYRMMDNQKKYAATTGESPSPTRCATATCSVWTTGTTPVSSRFSTSRARRPRRSLSFPHFSAGRLRSLTG